MSTRRAGRSWSPVLFSVALGSRPVIAPTGASPVVARQSSVSCLLTMSLVVGNILRSLSGSNCALMLGQARRRVGRLICVNLVEEEEELLARMFCSCAA